MDERFARVIVDVGPAHLDRYFDYALTEGQQVRTGSRVRVRFNGRPRTAWVAEVTDAPRVDQARVKPILAVDGGVSWFGHEDLTLWRWVADRWAGTMSGAIAHALPPRVIRVEREAAAWPVAPGLSGPDRDPDQRPPCAGPGWRPYNASALLKGTWRPHNSETPAGAFHLRAPIGHDEGPLLADLASRTLAAGRTVLVLAPSPAQGPADAVAALDEHAAVDLRRLGNDADRYRAFLRIRSGAIRLVVGARGAVLMPMPDLGLIIVTHEASDAYKERRNPRHHARDAALARGRLQDATVVLTSSLVSAATHGHLAGGHIQAVRMDRTSERSMAPPVQVIDRTALPPSDRRTRLVGPIARRMDAVLAEQGTIIVLAAAKGSGSSLACTQCRSRVECKVCAAGVSAVATDDGEPVQWRCNVCDWTSRPFGCFDCDSLDMFPLRAGAKRLATELARAYPNAQVTHMEGFDQPGPDRRPAIAVMTRGSIVGQPRWLRGAKADLLVIADPDVLVGRPIVAAAEDAVRLWLDAAVLANAVMLQTADPAHHAIQALVRTDPDGFWPPEVLRREPLGYPPVGSLVRFTGVSDVEAAELRAQVPGLLLGPDPDGAALLKTDQLRGTLSALLPLRRQWGQDGRRIRVDVDPVVGT